MSNEFDRELGWDDAIEKDSGFILLEEGDYDFTVESFERARHNGSEKISACNKAIIKIRVETKEGTATVNHNLLLHSKMEGMLSEFFTGIGLKKKGEKIVMNWNLVPGAKGRAKIGTRTYDGKKYNEIKKIYPKEEGNGKGFEAGRF